MNKRGVLSSRALLLGPDGRADRKRAAEAGDAEDAERRAEAPE